MERRWRGAVVAVVVSALAMTSSVVPGCGRDRRPTDSPAATAYRQFKDAGKVFDCLDSYDTVLAAGGQETFDVPRLRDAARQYAGTNDAYLKSLMAIAFPGPALPIADELRHTVRTEIGYLDLLAGISIPADAFPLLNQVYYGEAAYSETSDRLREALGNPVPRATRALSLFELARQTERRDAVTLNQLFDSALASADLVAAREVKRIEQARLADFRDALDAIDFPESFADRVADLKIKIEASIDVSRRQVDVPDTSRIVREPPQGGPEFQARQLAATTLADELARVDPPQSAPPTC